MKKRNGGRTRRLASAMLGIMALLQLGNIQWVRAASYELTVADTDQQEVKGWGVYPNSVGPDWEIRTAAHKAIYEDMGITQFRIELRGQAGDAEGKIVDSVYRYFLSNIRLGVEHGVKQYSVHLWSPPPGMKTNNDISGWNADKTQAHLLESKEQLLCDWIVRCLQGIQTAKLPLPIAFSLQNEPDVIKEYQSCGYEKDQYIRVVKLLRKTLDQAGYQDIVLMGPESGGYGQAYRWTGDGASALKSDPAYAAALGAFASHSYQYKQGSPDSDMARWLAICDAYPDKDRWQTEYCNGNDGSASAAQKTINAIQTLNADMIWARNNYWLWWLSFDTRYDPNAVNQEVLLGGDGISAVTKTSQYYALSRLYKGAPAGSRVRRVSATDPDLKTAQALKNDLSAYVTPQGNTALVVVNNQSVDKTYQVNGLTGKSAVVSTVGAGIDGVQDRMGLRISGGTLYQLEVPAKSVVIVVTGGNEAEPEGELVSVADWPIDFFYRCINNNDPVAGTAAVASEMAVGGPGTNTGNIHYAPLKLTLPEGAAKGTRVDRAVLKLYEKDYRMPFAVFYMPNDDWDENTGAAVMYDDSRRLLSTFFQFHSAQNPNPNRYQDLYPAYREEVRESQGYWDADTAQTMLESAASGVLKDNFLGVWGQRSQYVDNLLSIDITAAVQRAVDEGKSSVSLVLSAPGTQRTSFYGCAAGIPAEKRARYSMSWYGEAPPEPAVSVSGITFQNESGGVLDKLPAGGGRVRCVVAAENTYPAAKRVTAILASFQNGALSGLQTTELTVPPGGGSAAGDLLFVPAGHTVCAFVWEDTACMKPVDGASRAQL